jgi:hypothetical protein
MAKMGRPTVDDPSLHRVTVRFTESEYQALKKYAETHNQTMTQAMKIGIELLYRTSQK